jgi:hypothetical protein
MPFRDLNALMSSGTFGEHVGSQFAGAMMLLCDRQLIYHRDDIVRPLLLRVADCGSLRASVIVTSCKALALQGAWALKEVVADMIPS